MSSNLNNYFKKSTNAESGSSKTPSSLLRKDSKRKAPVEDERDDRDLACFQVDGDGKPLTDDNSANKRQKLSTAERKKKRSALKARYSYIMNQLNLYYNIMYYDFDNHNFNA